MAPADCRLVFSFRYDGRKGVGKHLTNLSRVHRAKYRKTQMINDKSKNLRPPAHARRSCSEGVSAEPGDIVFDGCQGMLDRCGTQETTEESPGICMKVFTVP